MDLLDKIADKGGGYLIAALLIFMGWRSQGGIVAVLNRTLDVLTEVKEAVATLTESNRGLEREIAGLRAAMHGIANAQSSLLTRVADLERDQLKRDGLR